MHVSVEKLISTLDGTRVCMRTPCWICQSTEAVLRKRYVKTELELFCDRCETWRGTRITFADLQRNCRQPLVALAAHPNLISPQQASR